MIRKALYATMAVVLVGASFSGVSVAQEEPAVTEVAIDDPGQITVEPLDPPKLCSIGLYDDPKYDDGGGGGSGGGTGC